MGDWGEPTSAQERNPVGEFLRLTALVLRQKHRTPFQHHHKNRSALRGKSARNEILSVNRGVPYSSDRRAPG